MKSLGLNNALPASFNVSNILGGMYGKYTYYIDKTTNQSLKSDMFMKVYYKEGVSVQGQLLPIKWEMVSGSMTYSNINDTKLNVILPHDAQNAKELTVPQIAPFQAPLK